MLHILKKRAETAEAQAAFAKHFEDAGESKTIKAGYKGATHELEGYWIVSEGIWIGFRVLANRYWNAFGIGLQPSNSVRCEINFPIEGKNEQVAGVFAKDQQGAVWVLHRGRIGGDKQSAL